MNIKSAFIALLLTSLCATSAYATEQGRQRQQARDTRQDTRDKARDVKHTCMSNNNQSNHECRQDKRQMKQNGREKARDIKY